MDARASSMHANVPLALGPVKVDSNLSCVSSRCRNYRPGENIFPPTVSLAQRPSPDLGTTLVLRVGHQTPSQPPHALPLILISAIHHPGSTVSQNWFIQDRTDSDFHKARCKRPSKPTTTDSALNYLQCIN
ncbi:hypothetical protein J6590_048638 [Homalodisca vitripennis]|nr:hypothetical protein J6590_048638 [Homalodisca vitripennis]